MDTFVILIFYLLTKKLNRQKARHRKEGVCRDLGTFTLTIQYIVAGPEATLLMTKNILTAFCFLGRTSALNNNWIVLPIVAFPCVLIGKPACQKNQLW